MTERDLHIHVLCGETVDQAKFNGKEKGKKSFEKSFLGHSGC
jgi:hypothetical protein